MTPTQILIVVALTAAGAIVQGSIGIGLTLVAGPALVAIDPAFAPGPLLVASLTISVRHIIAERHEADMDAVKHGLWGLPVGLIAALAVLAFVSKSTLSILVGGLTALAAVVLLGGATVKRTRVAEIAAGTACTFASVTAGLPGPPLVCVYEDMPAPKMRATSAMLIVWVAAIGFISLVLSGNFGRDEATLLAWLMPGIMLGLFSARWVRPLLNRPGFRTVVLVVALLGGLLLVLRQVR